MSTTQYIGPRIIPVFAPDVEWDIDNTYDHLTMVQHQGETFMSRQFVPVGASVNNVDILKRISNLEQVIFGKEE